MPDHDFTTQRLFVVADLGESERISASPEQSRYLLGVLRMREGDSVLLFNGRDGEWLAEIGPRQRRGCDLLVVRRTREQTQAPDLIFCFAPLKRGRLDYMVQKAVEMGAGRLQPILTQHSQVHRINLARMRANVREAAEQCGILSTPSVEEAVGFDYLLEAWPEGVELIFCDEREDGSKSDSLIRLSGLQGSRLGVLIGPEGGFSREEREALHSLPFVTAISLGPRILRSDTAAVAALALAQATVGDWGSRG